MPSAWWSRTGTSRPPVASLLALQPETERERSHFEVLVWHLYDRLLNNEVFGEDAAARVTELAYAIALPGVLVALFLFPAYHGLPPHPQERSFTSQACDHLFFVTYAFVVMGCAVIFQWEMLFPDALDASVLTTLPISLRRLLTARIAAMALFLMLVHAGTSGLGCLFLPAVADQRCGYFRQLLAQVTAVSMSGVCIVAALIALQAVLLWLPQGRWAEVTRGVVRICLLTGLMTTLFLFPLTAHYLGQLVGGGDGTATVRWLPTFWFLGVYDTIMWGDLAPSVFHKLARTGVLSTVAGLLIAAVTYPIGYQRRVQQLVEGSPLTMHGAGSGWLKSILNGVVLPRPRMRATGHLAAQTLLRTERLHLYLAMYIGLGTALVLSSVLGLRITGTHVAVVIQANGLRMAVPLVAFWAVAGLHTAMRSPVAKRGSWIFRAISGTPGQEELSGGRRLTVCVAWTAVVCMMVLLNACAPRGVPSVAEAGTQLLFGCGLPLLLAELLFADTRTAPFTGAARRSVHALPLAFVRYFVLMPAFVFTIAAGESWATSSRSKAACAALLLGGACVCARTFRVWLSSRPAPADELTLVMLHDD